MKPSRTSPAKTALLAALMCLAASSPALAERLTLDESVRMAEAQHPSVKAAELDARAAELQAAVARKGTLPALDLEGGYLRSTDKEGAPDFVANNGPNETRAQLVARLPLNTGALSAAVDSAEAARKAASWAARAARSQLALDVAGAYYGVLRAQRTIDSLRSALAQGQTQLGATRKMFSNGVVTRLDLRRTEAALASQEADLAAGEADLRIASDRFRLLTGASSAFTLVEPGAVPATGPTTRPGDRPEVEQAQATLAERQADARVAEGALRPQLALSGAAGWDTLTWPQAGNAGAQVGVDASWPLFDWGRLSAQAEAARLTAERSKQDLDVIRRTALLDYLDARAQLEKTARQVTALAKARGLAEQALDMARFGYKEGTVSNLEVLSAQKDALDARIAHENAIYDYHLAEARLRWAQGQ